MERPDIGFGMRHVALFVRDMSACEQFYVGLLGMEVEWRPDEHNLFLTSGADNVALHQANPELQRDEQGQRLDHIGFFIPVAEGVDEWYRWLNGHGVKIRTPPRDHRDGARSFYCYDPDGTLIQMIYHPPVSQWEQLRGVN